MSWPAFTAWFHSIPDVIWSGVIGALIGSGISYLSTRAINKGSDKRLMTQLAHDSQRAREQLAHDKDEARLQRAHDAAQNNEDRKAAIRREVYLVAVEKAHGLLSHLGGMLDQGLKEGVPFQDFLQANAKVWLVADLEAAHLARELTSLFGEMYMKAVPKVFEFAVLSAPFKAREKGVDAAVADRDRLASELQAARKTSASADRLEALQTSQYDASSIVDGLLQNQQDDAAAIHAARVDYMQSLFKDMRAVQQMLVRVVSALRKELHLHPDEEGFLAQLRDMEKRARASLGPLLSPEDDEVEQLVSPESGS